MLGLFSQYVYIYTIINQQKTRIMKKSENQITFKKSGRQDYMGFTWFAAYTANGEKVMIQNTHLKYKAMDEDHARRMHNQLS